MLSFTEKLAIIEEFPQLTRKDVSLGRVNFHFEESVRDKKIVVYHLHPNGNGFVYGGFLDNSLTNDKGFVNVRDYSEEALRDLIMTAIHYLSDEDDELSGEEHPQVDEEQIWVGPNQATLIVKHENELWNVYAGDNLEDAFESYAEAENYLLDEGFRRR